MTKGCTNNSLCSISGGPSPREQGRHRAQGAHLGARRDPLRDRRQLQRRAQGALQAGHAPLGELHVRQVRGEAARGPRPLYRLHRAPVRVRYFTKFMVP